MSEKKYAIVEVFHTIQGEGFHAGTPAIFIRFAGCNLWTGKPKDRERDAERHGAKCPRWCDTDFIKRESVTVEELRQMIVRLPRAAMFVLTGGEPLLQVDRPLVDMLLSIDAHMTIAVETNGTTAVPIDIRHLLWITMSPKVAPSKLILTNVDEIKVVFPDYDPQDYLDAGVRATYCFVQPRAQCLAKNVGRSLLDRDTMRRAAEFVMEHPRWRLSIQTHKLVGVP